MNNVVVENEVKKALPPVIIGWRKPEVVHDILNRSTDTQVHICTCCQNDCKGKFIGACSFFVLDEQDPAATEQRAFDFIFQNL